MIRESQRRGFTLVELLVVVAIILLLLAMLLPAIQKVREAANKAACASNLHNIAIGMHAYLADSKQFFPSGGGDNPRPRTMYGSNPALRRDQDWGWMYQILPYVEQTNLWKFSDEDAVKATPVPIYFCPSRRNPQAFMTPEAGLRAQNDYAGNIGCFSFYKEGGTYHSPCADGTGENKNTYPFYPFRNGVFIKSRYFKDPNLPNPTPVDDMIHARDIADGISNTLLASEKRMNLSYLGKPQFGDYGGFTYGYIADTLRAGQLSPAKDFESDNPNGATDRFGSAHTSSMNALFCDGSVRQITYDIPDNLQLCKAWHPFLTFFGVPEPADKQSIELTLFQRLCHRSDGGTVDLSLID